MASLAEKPEFKLTRLVLSKAQPFTLEEITTEAAGVGITGCDIERMMAQIRDAGIVYQYGRNYCLTETVQRASCGRCPLPGLQTV